MPLKNKHIINTTFLLILGTLLFGFQSYAQLVANFSSNKTGGCSPLVVEFYDQSTGGATSWLWDFGNGNTSTKKNPKASFTATGYYTVTLTISDGVNSQTIKRSKYIRVYGNPVAEFGTSNKTNGCIPYLVRFKDQSTTGDTTVVQWLWDFGDGATSNSKNPDYTFGIPGKYSISLVVKDANGCFDTKLKTDYISIHGLPNPSFTGTPLSFCTYPSDVSFTNQTKGKAPLTYSWDFGDQTQSPDENPVHTYNKAGSFNVKLTVTDSNSCVDSFQRPGYVSIKGVKARFKVRNDTLCLGENVAFTNTSTNATKYSWNFGDGNLSTTKNPAHVYALPGPYTIKLWVFDDKNCTDSFEKKIYIQEVTAGFSFNPKYDCKAPLGVHFTDTSKNASSFTWYFGDGGISTQKNPDYFYTQEGSFQIKQVVESAAGCRDSLISDSLVELIFPVAAFSIDSSEGCAPLGVDFTDASISREKITAYKWFYGDGDSSTGLNPSHIYTKDTVYKASLVIQNSRGCSDTSDLVTIKVGMLPIIDFEIDKDTACAYDSVQFIDKSTNVSGKKNDTWIWRFGDQMAGSGDQSTHQHVDTGWMNVRLIVGYNGCYDTLEKDSFHFIQAPVSVIEPQFKCDDPFKIKFEQTINKGVDRWEIYFGDLKFKLNVPGDTISHIYNKAGNYDYNTIAYNTSTGCIWKNNGTVTVGRNDPTFTPDHINLCRYQMLTLLAAPDSLKTLLSDRYDFGDNSSSPIGQHQYKLAGTYKIARYIEDVNNCKDSAFAYVNVYGAYARFETDTLACQAMPTAFTNTSTTDTTVLFYKWDFGDNEYDTVKNPKHIYAFEGVYSPYLLVEDVIGCRSAVRKTDYISVGRPLADFEAEDQKLCAFDNFTLINNSAGKQLSYHWYFGDGDSSSQDFPIHVYTKGGLFDVMLVAQDVYGCRDTMLKPAYANVQNIPKAGFTSDTAVSICYPLLVSFQDTSVSKFISKWYWTFGDNESGSFFNNPVHNYTRPGVYDVSLRVETSHGCSDSTTYKKYVQVNGPYAVLDLSPDSICVGETVDFWLSESENVKGFDWDFGDGNIEEGIDKQISHLYKSGGLLFPRIVYIDSSGQCRKFDIDTLYVSDVSSHFTADDTSNFVPLNVTFTDQSSSNVISWYWQFGDGSDTFARDASHFFDKVGIYEVGLYVKNDFGCIDTSYMLIYVEARPIYIDMPSVFTPDLPDNNLINIEGMGTRFKELLEFKIFNRWGEVVFETTDPKEGWDGTYKGEPQPIDTYIYMARVKTFENEVFSQKGYISLIR